MTTGDPASESARLPQRVRLPLHFRRLQVLAVEQPAARLIRVTVGGDQLTGFQSPGFDDHVKLFFPDPQTGQLLLPESGPDGPVWPDDVRPVMRDYTPHSHDADAGTLSLDFVVHDAGPATDWAVRAKPGDVLGVGGPRGSVRIPTNFDWHLLIGDETALPAIARRLAELPSGTRAIVVAEVEAIESQVPLASKADLSVHWCHRSGEAAGVSTRLADTVAAVELPTGDGFAWVACESRQARTLRLQLVQQLGLNPRWVKAAGYWCLGDSGVHDHIDD